MFNKNSSLTKKISGSSSVTLTAVALQDHWSRTLSLGTSLGPRKVGLGPPARAKLKSEVKSVIDTRRCKGKTGEEKGKDEDKEYVLDEKQPPLTLAQKFGLVYAPKPHLTEEEWKDVKEKSNQRDDSKEPCVICKEDFGLQEQVLLSCTHVFHRSCLQALERFTGRKSCPMCRHQQYQTRVIHEGARLHRHKCAARIQSVWRGYVVRCWYKQLRETVPPKEPILRKKFYQEKLSAIVDRMIKSIDVNMAEFLNEIDKSVQHSRAVFSQWDAIHSEITPKMWYAIQLKAVERGETDCPICLTELHFPDGSHSRDPFINTTSSPQEKPNNKSSSSQNSLTVNRNNRSKGKGHKVLEKPGQEGDQHPNQVKKLEENKVMNSCSSVTSHSRGQEQTRSVRSTVLLSCTHVFHTTCLNTLEEITIADMRNICPVCRAHYQKKVIV